MPIYQPPAQSPVYDPSQPYDPPLTSTATAIRYSATAKANVNAISSAPGHGTGFSPTVPASSSFGLLAPGSSSSSRGKRNSTVSFKEPQKDNDAKAKAAMKEKAKARLAINVPSTPRTPCSPRTAEIMAEMDGTIQVLRENFGRLSARGESIDALEARTEGLVKSAQAFRRSSKRMRREMQWKEIKMRLLIGFVVFVVLSLTIYSIVRAVHDAHTRGQMTVVAVVSVRPHPTPTAAVIGGSAEPTGTLTAILTATPTQTGLKTPSPTPVFIGQKPGADVALEKELEPAPVSAEGKRGEATEEATQERGGGATLDERDWFWFEDWE